MLQKEYTVPAFLFYTGKNVTPSMKMGPLSNIIAMVYPMISFAFRPQIPSVAIAQKGWARLVQVLP